MGTQLTRIALATLILTLSSFRIATADTLVSTDGTTYEGSISYANEREVTIQTKDGQLSVLEIASLEPASAAAVGEWSKTNPEFDGVYSKWDKKPVVVRSRTAITPPELNAPGFHGIVSLNVILDESGKVSRATVSKSTHEGLEEAAISTMRKWSFRPAQISGNNVKAHVTISFKFES